MIKRIVKLFCGCILLFLGLIVIIKIIDLINYKCPFKAWFNIYCAGCGATRMFKSILHLKFYQAFRYNPLIFILLMVSIPYVLYSAYLYIKKGTIKVPSFKVLMIIFAMLVIYMILRNIPEFYYLRPTKVY